MKKNKQQVLTDEQKTDAYIRRKMMEAADAYEAQLNADHSLDDIHLTDDMRADMLRRIAEADAEAFLHKDSKDTDGLCCVAEKPDPLPDCAQERAGENEAGEDASAASTDIRLLLSEEDRRALEIGKRALRFRKHRRCLQAAGILLVVGLGIACASMSSEASRIWWADLWDSLVGREAVSYLESADKTDEFDPQIRKICAEIKEKTNINALYFMYMPKDMVFDNYMVERDLGTATMQYRYRDTYLTVHMIKKKQDSVMGQITDGNILETVSVSTSYGTVKIHMQENLDGQENYSVEFVQNECSYKIYGMIAKEEFIKIIENSFFI